MSTYITRQELFQAGQSNASKSNSSSRRRGHAELAADEDGKDEGYVTTMFPPRKKARHAQETGGYDTNNFAIKGWLTSMREFVQNAISMQGEKTDIKGSQMKSLTVPAKTPTLDPTQKANLNSTAKKTPTSKETPKQGKTPRTTEKKPRRPRRCVNCMVKLGDEARAIACPGKMNRSKCPLPQE